MLTAFPLLKEGALPVDGLEGDREEVEEEVGGALTHEKCSNFLRRQSV